MSKLFYFGLLGIVPWGIVIKSLGGTPDFALAGLGFQVGCTITALVVFARAVRDRF